MARRCATRVSASSPVARRMQISSIASNILCARGTLAIGSRMFFFDWFHSFIPLRNPLGFGGADFVELAVALLLVMLLLARTRIQAILQTLAPQTGRCTLALASL